MPAKKKIKLINPKREPLTTEKLRELSGLNLSDEQAEEAVWSIRQLARILYEYVKQQKQLVENKNKPDIQ